MAHDRCDATRWDKTQCSATECGAAESVCEVTHRGDADKLDTQDARGGKREKSICYQCCQSVRMQISWHANIRRQMRECASSPCWVLAIISKQEEKGKASCTVQLSKLQHRYAGVCLASVNPKDGMRLRLCEWWHLRFLFSEGLSALLSTPARSSSKCHLLKIHVNHSVDSHRWVA